MRRREIQEEGENSHRWLVSYADFITLLFAFFVVMYSISSVNQGKYRVLSDSMSEAFHKQSNIDVQPAQQLGISVQRAPIALGQEDNAGLRSMTATAAKIEDRMRPFIKKGQIAVRGNEKWLEVEINTSILFGSGSAELSQPANEILSNLVEAFRDSGNPIYVSGYTDDLPINTVKFPSNWELSAARAASVVRLFADAGIDPSRLGAVGFGAFRPAVINYTEADRQKNRRVIIRMLSGEDMFGPTSPYAARSLPARATATDADRNPATQNVQSQLPDSSSSEPPQAAP
ncbi:MAG: chemotaxis protein MotB [Pseudomonadota bacterium]|nr:chemotaxis protein MotB [Pseudomonadota bacterium]